MDDINKRESSKKYSYQTELIFREYYAPLCYFASRYIENPEIGEDLVQDVFTLLIEKKAYFESELHLKNFLYISVKNSCLNYIRKENSRERYLAYKAREEDEEDNFVHNIVATEVYKELAEAITNLPTECRKVFELCYFEGLDNEKAAEQLGVSVNTIKAQKYRGKKILKETLRDLFPLFLFLFETV